ncbi:MAG: hypothetical protein IJL07_08805 [Lachnospiraceae bacterium]|nr:hypothetical protein [Lachnospiraceae bacterium]
MATKLKNLKVRKVDFVDEGANPDAHIRLKKNKDGEQSAGENGEKGTGFFKRLFSFIGKAAGMNQDEIDSAMDEIRKSDSVSFNEKYNEAKNRKIADEIWDICYALQSSLCSILNDEDLDSISASTAMQKSLNEFQTVVTGCISQWSEGKAASIAKKEEEVTEADIELMKSAVARLNEAITKATEPAAEGPETKNVEEPKGEVTEMKIDKSKLTDAERAFYESIEKKYGVEDEQQEQAQNTPAAPEVAKAATPAQAEAPAAPEGDDIYKGIHPAVKAELESLKKFRDEAETKEMMEVAKKYEIIGKKPEELAPVLKSLKAQGGTAYNDMIAVLDQTVETIEKSGAFSEVGKSGHSAAENSAEAKIGAIAKGMMEKDATLSYNQAVAKAWEENPELLAEYDEQEGF